MPGILPLSETTGKVSESFKTNGNTESKFRTLDHSHDLKTEDRGGMGYDGQNDIVMTNGGHANGELSPHSKPTRQLSDKSPDMSSPLPPEMPHYTTGYVPISTLISRLTQETFNDLGAVINEMAEMPTQQSSPNGLVNHVNHQVNGNAPANSEANIQKKLRLLDFTNTWRPKFIKALVLYHWARQAEAVGKVIDLKLWQDTQEEEYAKACFEMGQLHRIIACIKEPSPDLKTALQVLLLGKASWLPDMGYLQPEPLSPKQILDTLQRINTLLSIRLNIHENIPPTFRNFSISSGRVTFHVPDEFEVDLSIADEDPTSRLFFIDFRFAFAPGVASLPPGRLQADLLGRANDVLQREGLQGLFDLLHNLVLTHKLSVLRSQAYQMVKGYWSEHVIVEPVRRSLVVQYWSNKPGGKNWIEIGVQKGAGKRFSYLDTTQKLPQIAIRCFRSGKEVSNNDIDMRLGDLSMEYILKQVIAVHTSHDLQAICTKLNGFLLYASASLRLRNKTSTVEPTAASLMVQITPSKAIKIMREPVTGRFAVLPTSKLNGRLEYELNRLISPATDASSQISHLRALASQEEVENIAKALGWEPARSINPNKEVMRHHFPKGIQQTRFFRKSSWGSGWIVAFTTSIEGDIWWAVQLQGEETHAGSTAPTSPVSIIRAAYKVPLGDLVPLIFDASPDSLTLVERNAVGMISQHEDSRHLSSKHIPHVVRRGGTSLQSFSIFLRYPPVKAPQLTGSSKFPTVPRDSEFVRVDYHGVDARQSTALRMATARFNKPTTDLKDLISAISTINVNSTSRTFAFQLSSQIGQTCMPELDNQLSATERLLEYASSIKARKLLFTSASLKHIEFLYSQSPRLFKATIRFPPDEPARLSLSAPNPHLRILDFLNEGLATKGFGHVLTLLYLTLPLLTTLSSIEAQHNGVDYEIIARSEQWYEVRYLAPLPKSGFEIRLRTRRERPMWHISESEIRKGEGLSNDEEWNTSLRNVMRGKGENWRGMHGGIVAEFDGIGAAVESLDEVFRSARPAVAESRPGKRKKES